MPSKQLANQKKGHSSFREELDVEMKTYEQPMMMMMMMMVVQSVDCENIDLHTICHILPTLML